MRKLANHKPERVTYMKIDLQENQISYLEDLLTAEYEREDISETNRMVAYKILNALQNND